MIFKGGKYYLWKLCKHLHTWSAIGILLYLISRFILQPKAHHKLYVNQRGMYINSVKSHLNSKLYVFKYFQNHHSWRNKKLYMVLFLKVSIQVFLWSCVLQNIWGVHIFGPHFRIRHQNLISHRMLWWCWKLIWQFIHMYYEWEDWS